MARRKKELGGSEAVISYRNAKRAEKLMAGKKPSRRACDFADRHIDAAFRFANKLPKGGPTRKKALAIAYRAQDRYEVVCD